MRVPHMTLLESLSLVLVVLFAVTLVYAATTDYRHYLITNTTVIVVACLFALFMATQVVLPPESRVIEAPIGHMIKGGLLALLVFAVAAVLFATGLMGGGDVKLLTVVTLWAGSELVAPFLLVTALAGGVVTIGVMICARLRNGGSPADAVAFAPVGYTGQSEIDERRGGGTSQIINPLEPTMDLKVPYGLGICAGGLVVAYALAIQAPIFS